MDETAVPLKELFKAEISAVRGEIVALRDLVKAEQTGIALAVEKQAVDYNARFAGVNEWRQTFGDLAGRGVTRDVFDARLMDIDRRLSSIETKLATIEAMLPTVKGHDEALRGLKEWQSRVNGQFATWGVALLVFSTAVAILSRFINFGGG